LSTTEWVTGPMSSDRAAISSAGATLSTR